MSMALRRLADEVRSSKRPEQPANRLSDVLAEARKLRAPEFDRRRRIEEARREALRQRPASRGPRIGYADPSRKSLAAAEQLACEDAARLCAFVRVSIEETAIDD